MARWSALMAQRHAARERTRDREAGLQQRRVGAVLQKLAGQEMEWRYITGAIVMLQAFARGAVARTAVHRLRRSRIQGQLCAQQAAWKAKQLAGRAVWLGVEQHRPRANTRGLAEPVEVGRPRANTNGKGLAELMEVGRRLSLALDEVAPSPVSYS